MHDCGVAAWRWGPLQRVRPENCIQQVQAMAVNCVKIAGSRLPLGFACKISQISFLNRYVYFLRVYWSICIVSNDLFNSSFTNANLFCYCSSSAKLCFSCFSFFCVPTVKPQFEINKIDINPEKETSKPVYNQNKGTEENKAWHHKHSRNPFPSQRPSILPLILQCPFSLLAHTLYPPTNTQTGLFYS